MRVLLLDAYNLMHRARFGFAKGEHNIVFNFFRGLRPIVDKWSPDRIYFVLEGYPKNNVAALPGYKANRKPNPSDFTRQKAIIVKLVKDLLPIIAIRHEDYECDDVLYSIALNWHADDEVIVASGDSDFIQMYNEHKNVKIWHPIKKVVVEKPDFNYVEWKALRGDATDNIPGIKGIGDKTATKLIENPELLAERMKDPAFTAQRQLNIELIGLEDLKERMSELEISANQPHWDELGAQFDEFQFTTMRKQSTWDKYVKTFTNAERDAS